MRGVFDVRILREGMVGVGGMMWWLFGKSGGFVGLVGLCRYRLAAAGGGGLRWWPWRSWWRWVVGRF